MSEPPPPPPAPAPHGHDEAAVDDSQAISVAAHDQADHQGDGIGATADVDGSTITHDAHHEPSADQHDDANASTWDYTHANDDDDDDQHHHAQQEYDANAANDVHHDGDEAAAAAAMLAASDEATSREAIANLLLQNAAHHHDAQQQHHHHDENHDQHHHSDHHESGMGDEAADADMTQGDTTQGDTTQGDMTFDDASHHHEDPNTSAQADDSAMHEDADGSKQLAGQTRTPRKRARSKQKITRNRKITSCLECRARKQKCDRVKPVCSNCVEYARGSCTYIDGTGNSSANAVDEGTSRHFGTADANGTAGGHDAKRVRYADENDASTHSSLLRRRRDLIAKTAEMGRNQQYPLEVRIKCARAAAVGEALFGSPASVAHTRLRLPKTSEVKELLDIYSANVELAYNSVYVALNRPRIHTFLRWWHSDDPETLPPDPPLVPLLLVILALALQAKRTTHTEEAASEGAGADEESTSARPPIRMPGGRPRAVRERTPEHEWDFCSSERQLLDVAGRCIDSLQMVCPSNWSTAFAAPLDLVRASLLRGVYHLAELHLQFATNCFAAALRLAHAAGLHREPKHWKGMGREEAQARRNIWWNCVWAETVLTAKLVIPPLIMVDSFDTEVPRDYNALRNLFQRAEQLESAAFGVPCRVPPTPRWSFDFFSARFEFARLLIKHRAGAGAGDETTRSAATLRDLLAELDLALPPTMRSVMSSTGPALGDVDHVKDEAGDGVEGSSSGGEVQSAAEAKTRFCQQALLRISRLQTIIAIHRPSFDSQGNFQPPENPQASLQACLEASHQLVHIVFALLRSGPPFLVYGTACADLFQAAVILSILCALTGSASGASTPGQMTTTTSSSFRELARPIIQRAVETFDLVAGKAGLYHVAEQAARYASALREMESRPSRADKAGAPSTSGAAASSSAGGMGPQRGEPEGLGFGTGGQGYPVRHGSAEGEDESAAAAEAAAAVAEADAAAAAAVAAAAAWQSALGDVASAEPVAERPSGEGVAGGATAGSSSANLFEQLNHHHHHHAANGDGTGVEQLPPPPPAPLPASQGDDAARRAASSSSTMGGGAGAGAPSSNLELLAAQVVSSRRPGAAEQAWTNDQGGRGEHVLPDFGGAGGVVGGGAPGEGGGGGLGGHAGAGASGAGDAGLGALGGVATSTSSGGFAPLALAFSSAEGGGPAADVTTAHGHGHDDDDAAVAAAAAAAADAGGFFGSWHDVVAELQQGWPNSLPSVSVEAPPIESFNMEEWSALERMVERSLQEGG